MVVYITNRRTSGGEGHEHITHVRWLNRATGKGTIIPTAVMVEWIKGKKGVAKVTDGKSTVTVGVVDKPRPHLRTYADGKWTNNLLALPPC
ncbi:DUF3892 domain-containing protein [Sorangium sp. So ce1000]|uniref:DUF3892 domain-containing protein n=1 Tax=Sorangium sp. So ce1000 TaxID=3133325 RepID=UPI003F5F41F0